jgi:hypothetical protein
MLAPYANIVSGRRQLHRTSKSLRACLSSTKLARRALGAEHAQLSNAV